MTGAVLDTGDNTMSKTDSFDLRKLIFSPLILEKEKARVGERTRGRENIFKSLSIF